MKEYDFNKRVFSFLLERAKGKRSWRRFAMDSDVSYVQMRKLALLGQENPPRKRLLEKIASSSENGVELSDLMFAAGYTHVEPEIAEDRPTECGPDPAFSRLFDKYSDLLPRQKRDIEAFVDCLLKMNSAKKQKQQH